MELPNVNYAQQHERHTVERADVQDSHLLIAYDGLDRHPKTETPTSIGERTRYKVKIVMKKSLDPDELERIRRSVIYMYASHLYEREPDDIPTCKWFIFEDLKPEMYNIRAFPNLEGDMGFLYTKSLRDVTKNELEWVLEVPYQLCSQTGVSLSASEGWMHRRFETRRKLGLLSPCELEHDPIDYTCFMT